MENRKHGTTERSAEKCMLPVRGTVIMGSAAKTEYQAASLASKCGAPECTNRRGLSPQPMSGDDPAWTIAPAHECPTVGAYSRGDFVVIFMIWGFCRGKAHMEDLGTIFHTMEVLPRFDPCSRGNTLLLLGCFPCFMIRVIRFV